MARQGREVRVRIVVGDPFHHRREARRALRLLEREIRLRRRDREGPRADREGGWFRRRVRAFGATKRSSSRKNHHRDRRTTCDRARPQRGRAALSHRLREQHGADDLRRSERPDDRCERRVLSDGGLQPRGAHRQGLQVVHLPRRRGDHRSIASARVVERI